MPPSVLTAFENQPIPVGLSNEGSLSEAEADYLSLVAETRKGFCQRGYRSLKLAQFCGVVSLGGRVLEVLPKIDERDTAEACRGVMLRLLREAESFPLSRQSATAQHLRHAPLLDVFISAFFDSVDQIVRRGVIKGYLALEEDLRLVRGRIDFRRQLTVHANRPDRIANRFDELTIDNVWNRILKAGLRAVRPWMVSGELARRWFELMAIFEDVSDVRVDVASLRHLTFDRQARPYSPAVEWVRWILSLLSPAIRAGENAAPGLLFDMNLLFQEALASVLSRRAVDAGSVAVSAQEGGRYLAVSRSTGRRAFELRPDLLARRVGRTVAVGDTKWKRLEMDRDGYLIPGPDDIYQMNAYASGFRCNELALIYPWHEGLANSFATSFELSAMEGLHPVVDILCVDVFDDHFSCRSANPDGEFAKLLSASRTLVSEAASA